MAILPDSNIIIYSYLEKYNYLREIYSDTSICISAITRVEVLGYYQLNYDEKNFYEDIFSFIRIFDISTEILEKAIELRQQFKIKLGDSIIAATALTHSLTLYTRNLSDFGKIKGLTCINPVR